MVQPGRKIYVDLMRICKTFRFIPECVFFSDTDIADFHNRRRSVDTGSVFEYRNEHFTQCVGTALDLCFFPRFKRIKDDQIFGRIIRFICKTDQIGTDFAGLFVVNTKDLLVAWICDFFCIFGKFDFRDKFAGLFIEHGSKLVDTSESGAVLGGDHVRADSPGGNCSALCFQAVDQVLVKVA